VAPNEVLHPTGAAFRRFAVQRLTSGPASLALAFEENRACRMALCECCNQEMFTAVTCTANPPFAVDGTTYTPFAAEEDCGDCGVSAGGLHHPGCEIESCPCCGEQRLYCNCANPQCTVCHTKMEYVGADEKGACYDCPSCGAEQ
jgi:hypothetical protein